MYYQNSFYEVVNPSAQIYGKQGMLKVEWILFINFELFKKKLMKPYIGLNFYIKVIILTLKNIKVSMISGMSYFG